MIINKLEMFNFRQYVGHQTVTFSTDKHKNVTVLVGINTSGKTTLVRAFEWCLYGKNGFDDPVLLKHILVHTRPKSPMKTNSVSA